MNWWTSSALNLSSLYMTAGLGAAVSLKSGELNLGGEGQVYAGGFLAAVILAKFDTATPAFLIPTALLLAFLAAFAIPGLICLFCAFLKKIRKADFLFTSYIASAATIPFIDGMIAGPFRSKGDNLLATPFIAKSFRTPTIFAGSQVSLSLVIGICLCIAFFFLLYKSSYGRKLSIYGISEKFANYAGYRTHSLSYSSAFISGGMHGLCGAMAVTAIYFSCHSGFYSSMGWNSLSAALIARSNPLLLIPSSLFMAFLTTYANKAAMYGQVNFDLSGLLQAVILFSIAFLGNFKAKRGRQ